MFRSQDAVFFVCFGISFHKQRKSNIVFNHKNNYQIIMTRRFFSRIIYEKCRILQVIQTPTSPLSLHPSKKKIQFPFQFDQDENIKTAAAVCFFKISFTKSSFIYDLLFYDIFARGYHGIYTYTSKSSGKTFCAVVNYFLVD